MDGCREIPLFGESLKLSLTLPHKGKMNFFTPKCHFLDNFVEKNWQWLEFSEKIFGFPYLSLKLSLTLPNKEKCFGVHILGPSLNQQIFPELEISSKIEF